MIDRIALSNYKCFSEIDVPLKNINILTGLNGMGKSSLIQALLLLRQSYKSNGLKEGLELSGSYIDLGQGVDILYEKASVDDHIRIIIGEGGKTYTYEFNYISDSTLQPVKVEPSLADSITTDNFVYLSAYRIEPLKFYRTANHQDIDKRDFGNDGEYSLQYLSEHGPDLMTRAEESTDENLSQQVQRWLNVISPGANAVVNVNNLLNVSELRFRFTEGKNNTNDYRCVNVGFGLTYVLPILISLLSARKGDIVVLENPEAHIHPAGQRKLGELIAETGQRGVQVIVETHSDHIMNGIRIAARMKQVDADLVNFVYFYKNEKYEHTCIYPKLNQEGKFDHWPEGFFDEWDNSLMDLL